MYPFLLNSVNRLGYELDKEYFDIQGVYGYNGALFSSCSAKFLKDFSQSLLNYCREHNIITEFTRFNPILKNHNTYINSPNFTLEKIKKTLYLDYRDNNYDKGFSKNVFRNLNKAKKNLLYLDKDQTIENFNIGDDYETFIICSMVFIYIEYGFFGKRNLSFI